MKVGDVFTQIDFGHKVNYKVTKVNADGSYVSEVAIGIVEKPIEDIIEELKEPKAEKKPVAKKTTTKKK